MFPWEYVGGLWATTSEGVGLIGRAVSFQDFQPVWSWSTNVTDGRTDGQTDRRHGSFHSRISCYMEMYKLLCSAYNSGRTNFVIITRWPIVFAVWQIWVTSIFNSFVSFQRVVDTTDFAPFYSARLCHSMSSVLLSVAFRYTVITKVGILHKHTAEELKIPVHIDPNIGDLVQRKHPQN